MAQNLQRQLVIRIVCVLPAFVLGGALAQSAETPSVKLALTFKPVQSPVDYEVVAESEYAKCKVEVERTAATSGWVVKGASGQTLRRFVDTNGDNIVDQWRYFQNGLEVYRDIDSNFNNKVDESRWLNTGGTRWGRDVNEDSKIDQWKRLSAEEATLEAVQALVSQDANRMSAILVNQTDMTQLGLAQKLADQLLKSVASPATKMRTALSGKSLKSNSRWTRFDNSTLTPSLVPADSGKARQDLLVYQSAVAIVETGGSTGLVQIGEMILVGNVWKLTQVPHPIEGNTLTTTGILMQPDLVASNVPGTPLGGQVSPQMQALLKQLQELDETAGAAGANSQALSRYNRQRAELLEKLVAEASTAEEREQWTRQMVDGLAAAVQTGGFPDGLKKLQTLSSDLPKNANPSLKAYVAYRYLLATYSQRVQSATTGEGRADVQKWWLEQLEGFVREHRKADDAADALLQLAIAQEFGGKLAEAKKWYRQITTEHPQAAAAQRAQGALDRFDLPDKQLTLTGTGLTGGEIDISDYRGRVVLVTFWATWCKPCTEDLPQMLEIYKKYHDQGFEIVGVNLDTASDLIQPYLTKHGVSWPTIFEPGGLESPPATQFGIISLPTMFLVNSKGVVVSRNATVADLKVQLPQLLAK